MKVSHFRFCFILAFQAARWQEQEQTSLLLCPLLPGHLTALAEACASLCPPLVWLSAETANRLLFYCFYRCRQKLPAAFSHSSAVPIPILTALPARVSI